MNIGINDNDSSDAQQLRMHLVKQITDHLPKAVAQLFDTRHGVRISAIKLGQMKKNSPARQETAAALFEVAKRELPQWFNETMQEQFLQAFGIDRSQLVCFVDPLRSAPNVGGKRVILKTEAEAARPNTKQAENYWKQENKHARLTALLNLGCAIRIDKDRNFNCMLLLGDLAKSEKDISALSDEERQALGWLYNLMSRKASFWFDSKKQATFKADWHLDPILQERARKFAPRFARSDDKPTPPLSY